MEEKLKHELIDRNKRIIDMIIEKINKDCPNTIDLIGIGGSFCSGDIYEKSDLDLLIIKNDESAGVLDKCFILKDIGFDIYTQDWNHFEKMTEYNNPYVTKLFDLDIVYIKNEEVLNKYISLRNKVKENMNDTESINKKIGYHFVNVLNSYKLLNETDDILIGYKNLEKIITGIEFIIYMVNRTYVKKGIKRIPEEISNMKILPDNFMDTYLDITNCSTLKEMNFKSTILINSIKKLLDSMSIDYNLDIPLEEVHEKNPITSSDIIGTYEEIYSNYKNKMYHAVNINDRYLSFKTMAGCQIFYDDITNNYDIEPINLIDKYDKDDLMKNAISFDNAMEEWKKLYDKLGVNINYYDNIEELENDYINKRR